MNADGSDAGVQRTEPAWVGQVLDYWFNELGERQWFNANHELDGQIRARFLTLHEQLASGELDAVATPRGLLAAIIVLDQFPRNMFRGTARAFDSDALARKLANAALTQQFDHGLSVHERQFLYLPFQHSEDRADQARSAALYARLGDANLSRYALAHQSIIDRFGRFPHRNAILDRHSSAEELALLKEPMGSF